MSDRVRRDGSRFGFRTIRPGGRVRWCGRWFRLRDGALPMDLYMLVSHEFKNRRENSPRYDGRLDGCRALFYDYGDYRGHFPHLADSVWLHSVVGAKWPGPQCVRGVFHWDKFEVMA